jgi:hypothetical protein
MMTLEILHTLPLKHNIFQFLEVRWEWIHLVHWTQFCLLYQPWMIDDECGAVGGIRFGSRNRSTWRKPVPMPLRPPQIPQDLTWDRTQAATVGSRRLTVWDTARLKHNIKSYRQNWTHHQRRDWCNQIIRIQFGYCH